MEREEAQKIASKTRQVDESNGKSCYDTLIDTIMIYGERIESLESKDTTPRPSAEEFLKKKLNIVDLAAHKYTYNICINDMIQLMEEYASLAQPNTQEIGEELTEGQRMLGVILAYRSRHEYRHSIKNNRFSAQAVPMLTQLYEDCKKKLSPKENNIHTNKGKIDFSRIKKEAQNNMLKAQEEEDMLLYNHYAGELSMLSRIEYLLSSLPTTENKIKEYDVILDHCIYIFDKLMSDEVQFFHSAIELGAFSEIDGKELEAKIEVALKGLKNLSTLPLSHQENKITEEEIIKIISKEAEGNYLINNLKKRQIAKQILSTLSTKTD